MQKNSRNVKVAEQVINLTGKIIRVYDDASGEIVELPIASWMSDPVRDAFGHPQIYYVVDAIATTSIGRTGRTQDDIAVISTTQVGRGGVKVSYLALAENRDVVVRYRRPTAFRVA